MPTEGKPKRRWGRLVTLKGKPQQVTLPCGKRIRLDKLTGKGHLQIEVVVVEPELTEESSVK